MLDVAAIVVAVIAFVASVFAAIISWCAARSLDKRKSIRDAEALLHKYQDPLLLAARDLQSRLYNILFLDVLSYGDGTPEQQDALYIYTPFLVGQFFAWIHIQHQEGKFMALTGERLQFERTKDFIKRENQITELLNTGCLEEYSDDRTGWRDRICSWHRGRKWSSRPIDMERRIDEERRIAEERSLDGQRRESGPFVLWKDQQRAIGEIMSKGRDKSTGELVCMDYTEFSERWKAGDCTLHTWFSPVHTAMKILASSSSGSATTQGLAICGFCSDLLKKRLLSLQNLLVDLISVLDREGLVGAGEASTSKGLLENIDLSGGVYCTCQTPE